VLDVLQARGDQLNDFSATVRLADTDAGIGGTNGHTGTIVFQKRADGDARLIVKFTQQETGDRLVAENHVYKLDGGWLIERDYLNKNEVRREVVAPGEKMNVLKLGEGPFPLPIGQDKEDVKKLFDAKLVAPGKKDPPDTAHVSLTPHDNTELARKFQSVDVWTSRQNGMPLRIKTLDAGGAKIQTTDLTHLKLNAGVSDADFDLPKVDGFAVTVEPYRR
jgi:outer membrane lipoprotein-sorting protein